jgi:hypothetical protein
LPAFAFDDFGDDFGLASLDSLACFELPWEETDGEGDFVTAIAEPEFGAAGLFEVSVVEEAGGERVAAEVFKFSVVMGPVEEPVPVEVFELI